jgi:hypothetical protein
MLTNFSKTFPNIKLSENSVAFFGHDKQKWAASRQTDTENRHIKTNMYGFADMSKRLLCPHNMIYTEAFLENDLSSCVSAMAEETFMSRGPYCICQ